MSTKTVSYKRIEVILGTESLVKFAWKKWNSKKGHKDLEILISYAKNSDMLFFFFNLEQNWA